jgi:hypothetical protein
MQLEGAYYPHADPKTYWFVQPPNWSRGVVRGNVAKDKDYNIPDFTNPTWKSLAIGITWRLNELAPVVL